MTNEHLRPHLENARDIHLFFRACEILARSEVQDNVATVLRRGRMTALQKPGVGSGV